LGWLLQQNGIEMRAIVFDRFGEPAEVLSLRDVPLPEPGPGQVRVRMLVAPINPSDLMVIRGSYARLPTLPATPGFEGVGIVEAAGPGLLGKFYKGKRVVVPNSRTGSWADYAVLPTKMAIPISNKIPLEQAAMFLVNPATAYIMTRRVLAVPVGGTLLQTAAGSALGRMVIRLGKRFGFRIINVVRRREQVAELRELGAETVLCEADGDLSEQVLKATNAEGVRYAIDPVGGATGTAVVRSLAVGGRMLVFGTLSNEPLSLSPRELIARDATVSGFWLGNWMMQQKLLGKLKLIRTLTGLILDGVLVSDVGESFPLEGIADAVRSAEQTARKGKTLLRIGTP
jgi:NADPH:quinone reductase-like Zn-dependent oxidoreductase